MSRQPTVLDLEEDAAARPIRPRHRAEYLGYRAIRRLLALLPLAAVRRLGRAAGGLYWAVGAARRRSTVSNLAHALPEGRGRHGAIARRCFQSQGAIFFETLRAYGAGPESLRAHFDVLGAEHLDTALALGRGCLLVTGHYGNWELALWPLRQRLEPIHVVARRLTNPAVDRDVAGLRRRVGYELLPRRSAGFRMLKVLRRGGNVALLFDQRVKPRDGILCSFLGRPAWLTPLPAALSIHTGAPVVLVFCVPAGKERYAVSVLPPILPEGAGPEAEAALTRRYLAPLEERIRGEPELWLWMHRLWRVTQRDRRADSLVLNRRLSGLEVPEPAALPALPPAARALTSRARLERAENAVIVAAEPAGREAGRAVAEALLGTGHRVRWVEAQHLAAELAAARSAADLARAWRELDLCDLLVVDLGRGPLAAGDAREIVELWRQRAGRRSTLVTTPIPVEEWERVFGDAAPAAAARRELVARTVLLS